MTVTVMFDFFLGYDFDIKENNAYLESLSSYTTMYGKEYFDLASDISFFSQKDMRTFRKKCNFRLTYTDKQFTMLCMKKSLENLIIIRNS